MRLRQYREELIESEGRCWYCGFDLRENRFAATLDHIVPRAKGGTSYYKNLRLSCRRCNQAKSDHPETWLLFHVSGCVLAENNKRGVLRKIARASAAPIHTPADDSWRTLTPKERRKRRRREARRGLLPSHGHETA